MLTVIVLLLLAAFVCTIASALGKAPLWISVLLVIVAALLQRLPP